MSYNNQPGPNRRHVPVVSSSSFAPTNTYSDSFFQMETDNNNFSSNWNNNDNGQNFQTSNSIGSNTFNAFSYSSPPPVQSFNDGYYGQIPSSTSQPTLQPTTNVQSMFNNQQFLMAAGQQLLTNPITVAAIDTYSQSLVSKGRGWIGNLKQYFAVDTNYVLKKLTLIFLPFLHKDWTIRYNSEDVAPRDEPNLPDLYIPSMAFITYILVSGYILGLKNKFAPEQLGIYASSALAWVLLEVFIILIAKYLLNLSTLLNFFHMIAFGGYKFVCIVAILVSTLMLGNNAYYALFCYTSISLGYFLIRTLSTNLQTSQQSSYQYGDQTSYRSSQYLVILIALFQPMVMFFLTSSLTK